MKKKNNTDSMLLRMKKKLHKLENHISPFVFPVLMAFFVGLDYIALYTLIDTYFYQSAIVSQFVTIGIAVVLEGIPWIGAQFFCRENKTLRDKGALMSLALAYAVLIGILAALRWYSRDMSFGAAETALTVTVFQTPETTAAQSSISPGQNMVTVLFAVSPLITSILAFWVSCVETSKDRMRKQQELNLIRIEERIGFVKACINEIQRELDRDLFAYDEELYDIACDGLDGIEELACRHVARCVAEKIGIPDALTGLAEE